MEHLREFKLKTVYSLTGSDVLNVLEKNGVRITNLSDQCLDQILKELRTDFFHSWEHEVMLKLTCVRDKIEK